MKKIRLKKLKFTPFLILAFGVAFTLGLYACGGDATGVVLSSPSASVPATSVQPTSANPNSGLSPTTGQPQTSLLQSQGLGLLKADWEKLHGQGAQVAPGLPSYQYENNKFLVIFAGDRVGQIQRRFSEGPVSLDAARQESKLFYPTDSKLVKNLAPAKGKDPIDVFSSDMLKTAFNQLQGIPGLWAGGEPGTFAVAFRPGGNNQIDSIVLALGVNL